MSDTNLNRVYETRTYINPIRPDYFADPFVWEAKGEYYAVATGPVEAAGEVVDAERAATGLLAQLRIFPMLRSDDFVHWQPIRHALIPPDPALGGEFWAPEVAHHNGIYYMYYSIGGGQVGRHVLRVATSPHPMGPYTDSGKNLVQPEHSPFSIDAHPFQDENGQWYLFYACDFFDSENGMRPGTGIVVDRLLDMTTLAGEPKIVLRPRSDWQRFESGLFIYGQVFDWHTLEAPAVRKHDGKYYCFYSGGRWENESYSVDYGVADHVLGPYSDAGSESGGRLLQTIPGHVVGPGHCSIVMGPDHETEYVVYHAWDAAQTARQMRMDRLQWTPNGPRCLPTGTPQEVRALVDPQKGL